MERIVFPRSATKIFQCLALASLKPDVSQKEYSVICSSHNGQEEHTEVVDQFLRKNSLLIKRTLCRLGSRYRSITPESCNIRSQ